MHETPNSKIEQKESATDKVAERASKKLQAPFEQCYFENCFHVSEGLVASPWFTACTNLTTSSSYLAIPHNVAIYYHMDLIVVLEFFFSSHSFQAITTSRESSNS
jgi:hypothetical protein